MSTKKQLVAPKPAMRHLNCDYFTLPQLIEYANAVADDVNNEANDYYSFILAIAGYLGCPQDADMRDFIHRELLELKKQAEIGKKLALTVMSDQTGKS